VGIVEELVEIWPNEVCDKKKEQPAPVIIEKKEEWEIEKILNKRQIRGKNKYLVH